MIFFQYVFTFTAWEMAMTPEHLETSKISTFNHPFLSIDLNSSSWPSPFNDICIPFCVQDGGGRIAEAGRLWGEQDHREEDEKVREGGTAEGDQGEGQKEQLEYPYPSVCVSANTSSAQCTQDRFGIDLSAWRELRDQCKSLCWIIIGCSWDLGWERGCRVPPPFPPNTYTPVLYCRWAIRNKRCKDDLALVS